MKRALHVVLALSLFGVVFSGVLSYQELFTEAALECPPLGASGTVFGYPACIYGFFMYLGVAITALLGLHVGRRTASQPKPA